MAKAYIGISGWTFPGWKKQFYPKGLPARRELEYASRQVNSIEINGTFYSLQRPTSFQKWYSETPEGFVFAVKAPQFITHVLRLKEAKEPLCNFLASGLLCLKEKLGPILWQFPPNVMLKDKRFEKFLKYLPPSTKAAAKLAKKHGDRVEGRAFTETDADRPLRHAFEFRHKSFLNADFLALLKHHNVAFVYAHAIGKGAYVEEPTADFEYVRLHGEGKPYKKGYPKKELSRWAERLEENVSRRHDTYVYFTNEAKKFSPAGALELQSLLNDRKPSKKLLKAG